MVRWEQGRDAVLRVDEQQGNVDDESLDRAARCEFDRDRLRRPGVPRGLAAICLKAMSPHPADRHADVKALAHALSRYAQRPMSRLLAFLVAASLSIAVLAGGFFLTRSTTPLPAEFQELVHVHRQDGYRSLLETTMLTTNDECLIRCDIPTGYQPALFWFGSEGNLTQFPPDQLRLSPSGAITRLAYPPSDAITIQGSPGTEFIFVCASRHGTPELAQVRAIFEELGLLEPWPALAPHVRLAMHQERVEMRTVDSGETIRDPGFLTHSAAASVEERMDRLREKLGERFPFVIGIAFSHGQP